MSINKIVAKRIFALADEITADTDYVYDPTHQNKPHDGGNWHKTEKGWSTKEKTKKQALTPEQKQLVKLSQSEERSDRMKAASSPNLPVEALVKLSEDVNLGVQGEAARNPNMPSEVLEKMSKNDYWDVRAGVASNPNTPYDVVVKLQEDDDKDVYTVADKVLKTKKDELLEQAMASSEYTPRQKELIKMARSFAPLYSKDFTEMLMRREKAAVDKDLPLPFLRRLLDDKYDSVVLTVLKNPSIPEEDLKKLVLKDKGNNFGKFAEDACKHPNMKDPDFLREATKFGRSAELGVLENPYTPVDVLETYSRHEKFPFDRASCAKHPNATPEMLERLSKDEAWEVREAVAGNKKTPKEVLRELSYDERFAVRGAVGGNENTDPDVLDRMSWTNEERYVREAVAGNPNTPPKALVRLTKDPNSDVRNKAIRNPNLPLEGEKK